MEEKNRAVYQSRKKFSRRYENEKSSRCLSGFIGYWFL